MSSIYQQTQRSRNNTDTTALSTAFANVRTHDLGAYDGYDEDKIWMGTLDTIQLHVDTIANAPTALTLRVTSDAAGDRVLIPDTSAALLTGLTTATEGTASYAVDQALSTVCGSTDSKVYLWVKTDVATSTAVIVDSLITWRK